VVTEIDHPGRLRAVEGATVRIKHDREDPHTARLVGDADDGLARSVSGPAFVIIGVGTVFRLLFPPVWRILLLAPDRPPGSARVRVPAIR
jgi:hypothetical protein